MEILLEEQASTEVNFAADLWDAFPWVSTKKGRIFWQRIWETRRFNPKEYLVEDPEPLAAFTPEESPFMAETLPYHLLPAVEQKEFRETLLTDKQAFRSWLGVKG